MPLIERIPKDYQSGFISLSLMRSSSFIKLNNLLDKSQFHPDIDSLVSNLAQSPLLKYNEVYNILGSVQSLFSFIDKNEVKSVEVSKDIARILRKNKIIRTKKVSIKRFENRLTKLLDNEQLYVAYKSHTIYLHHKNLYLNSKILSDIRPIFTKPNLNAKASLVTNTLHIHYRSGEREDDHYDFFIALDTKDLQQLKKTILRAEQKNETLKRMIKKSNMAYLDPSEEN